MWVQCGENLAANVVYLLYFDPVTRINVYSYTFYCSSVSRISVANVLLVQFVIEIKMC